LTAAAVISMPPWATSSEPPTTVCTAVSAEGMLTSSQWKLYFSQKPFLAATKPCMLPIDPRK
jgi:hypothetical protein